MSAFVILFSLFWTLAKVIESDGRLFCCLKVSLLRYFRQVRVSFAFALSQYWINGLDTAVCAPWVTWFATHWKLHKASIY